MGRRTQRGWSRVRCGLCVWPRATLLPAFKLNRVYVNIGLNRKHANVVVRYVSVVLVTYLCISEAT